MSNPFESSKRSDRQIAFDQLINMKFNESIEADLGNGTVATYRANVSDISRMISREFKTKVNSEGDLWVKRIG